MGPERWSADGHVNFDGIEGVVPAGVDVVLLPELVGSSLARGEYLERLRGLAAETEATVVGGSYYDRTEAGVVNRGAVVDPRGEVVAEYDKVHPYGVEQQTGVIPGAPSHGFELLGRRAQVLLCADLWYSGSLARLADPVDVVLVPAFSVTQWGTPLPARTLWEHMSVARAYEFMTYVAVSDWHHEATYHGHPCAGVTGLANPCPTTGVFFTPGATVHDLDFPRLTAFRADRATRNFR